MIQDPNDQYIATLLSCCGISGKDLLEIGCGKGRITKDLAKYARRVVACDPDSTVLEVAQREISAENVEFVQAPTGVPDLPARSFDVVIYTLSLHHVPVGEMSGSLRKAASLLRDGGVIVVIEPGDGGSFTEAKERFGAGSGDERTAKKAAICAMSALDGWAMEEQILFHTQFQFDSYEDFFKNMMPGYCSQSENLIDDVKRYLDRHLSENGIILDAERWLNLLRSSKGADHG